MPAAATVEWTPPVEDRVDVPWTPPVEDRVVPTKAAVKESNIATPEQLAALQPASAGLMAGQPRGGVPVPRIITDIALEGGGATAGQLAGAPLAPVTFGLSVPIGGAIGAGSGNYLAQRLRVSSGEQDKVHPGEVLGAALTGAIPGASLEGAGGKALAREAVKQGGAGLARNIIQTGIDDGNLPSLESAALSAIAPAIGGAAGQKITALSPEVQAAAKAAEAAKTVEQKTFDAGKKLGLKTSNEAGKPPAVEANLLSTKNRPKINAAVVEELGLPKNTEITPDILDNIRFEEGKPYAEIDRIATDAAKKAADIRKQRFTASNPHDLAIQMADPKTVAELAPLDIQAAADVNALREARKATSKGFRAYNQTGDPKALDAAEAALELASKLEGQIDAAAVSSGSKDLLGELAASRTRIAKTYDVERALNLGNSDISAPALARRMKAGRPLTGNLKTIADYAQAFPFAVKEGASTMAPGITRTEAMVAALALAQKSKLAALLPLAGSLKRQVQLSDLYQSAFPRYPVPALDQRLIPVEARAAKLLSQAAGASSADQN